MRKAVIDLGSNSIKMAIGEFFDGKLNILEFLKNIIPIGKTSFAKGKISQAVINQTVDILNRYEQKSKEYDVDEIRVIATTAIREARNKDIFLDQIQRKTGFKVQVLEVGDVIFFMDSYISSQLKTFPIKKENLLIAELGTGNLDVSGLQKGTLFFQTGFALGTYRLSRLIERLSGSTQENQEAVEEYINNEFSYLQKSIKSIPINDIILVDENYSQYISYFISSKANRNNFYRYTQKEIETLENKLDTKTYDEIASKFPIPPELVRTFPAYAALLKNLCNLINKRHIHILNITLSKTILSHLFQENKPIKKNRDNTPIINTAKFIAKKFNQDMKHIEQVAFLSEILFECFKKPLGLSEKYNVYLIVAAYLHDIGIFISERAHHKHSEYVIQSLNLLRMKDKDKKIIACIGRYHRKALPRMSHPVYASLSGTEKLIVQKLSSLLRMANSLDCSHSQKVKNITVQSLNKSTVNLKIFCKKNYLLEKSEFLNQKTFFEDLTGITINII